MKTAINITLVLVVGILAIALVNMVRIQDNNTVLKGSVDKLTLDQQRLLANNYLITSNNALLLQNQKVTVGQNKMLHEIVASGISEANKQLERNIALTQQIANQTAVIKENNEVAVKANIHVLALIQNQTNTLNKLINAIVHATATCPAKVPTAVQSQMCRAR